MSENRNRLKSYLNPIEIKEDVIAAAAVEMDPPPPVVAEAAVLHLAKAEPLVAPQAPLAPLLEDQHRLFAKLVERLEALSEPVVVEPEPVIHPIVLEKLVERLEALSERPAISESEQHIEHLYELHQSVVSTLATLTETLHTRPDHSMALLEHMTSSLAHQQAEIVALADNQRDIVLSLNESQVAIARVIVSLVEKVNALTQAKPVFNIPPPIVNIPAPVVNVQVKEGGVITKTIERDERGLISKVTEGPAKC